MGVENINDVSNGMALRNWVHEEFGKFTLALKPTVSTKQANIRNCYSGLLTEMCAIRIRTMCMSLKSFGNFREQRENYSLRVAVLNLREQKMHKT